MTYQQLTEKLLTLQKECIEKQTLLKRQYAEEHNPVKVGDVVTDHYHTVKVEDMELDGYPVPYMKYWGREMTVKGHFRKRRPIPENPVYQCDIISINGKEYQFTINEE